MSSSLDWMFYLVALVFALFFGVLFYGIYDIQKATEAIGEAQDAVFTQINHNTTNAEILVLINKECKASGYKDRCVSKLRDSFVINAKGT